MIRNRALVKPAIRQAEICDLLERKGEASVEAMAKRFETSAETIRRDLSLLADSGKLQKVHGGARRILRREEGGFKERLARNALAKRLIAEKVVSLVSPGQTLFMDTGSTTLICAEALAKVKNLTVITNSTRIATAISEGSGKSGVFLLGGQFRPDNAQTIGPTTLREIAQFRADHAILTIGALNEGGAFDYSDDEAHVARAMLAASAQINVVVDHSKIGQCATHRVCALTSINRLILDRPPPQALGDTIIKAGVELR